MYRHKKRGSWCDIICQNMQAPNDYKCNNKIAALRESRAHIRTVPQAAHDIVTGDTERRCREVKTPVANSGVPVDQ